MLPPVDLKNRDIIKQNQYLPETQVIFQKVCQIMNALKNQKFHSIRFSLTAVVALLILLSVFFTSVLSYYRYTEDFQRQSSQQIEQTLEQLSINLSAYIDELFRLTTYLYYDNQVVNAMEATGGSDMDRLNRRRVIENYLDKIMILPRKDVLNIFVITDSIYYGGKMPKSVDLYTDYTAYDWYQAALEDSKPIFVPPHTEQLVSYPKDTVFSIVKQLKSVKNIDQRIGVIKVDASYEGISDIVQKVDMGEDGGIYIMDGNQNLIYNSIPFPQTDLLSQAVFSSPGAWTQKIDGSEYLINTVKVQDPDWTIVSVNSLRELTKNAQKTRNFTFILATLSSCTAILVLLFFTHRILHPLMEIVQLMKEVRNGNFQVSFTGKRNDEIGYLGDSFNKMTETITYNIKRNTELTTKVYQTEILHTEARLHALQNQIKPHFLYNTLNMISLQIQVGRTVHAVSNIERLHNLLRGMAKLDREALVEEEFSLLNDYLALQSSRFEGRLDYQLKLEEAMKGRYILTLILQPLVENAVIHGCENQRSHTFILVEGYCKEEKSYFSVKDNGKGMSETVLHSLMEKLDRTADPVSEDGSGHSIGLENVNTRIKLRYGSEYGICVSSIPDIGTEFTIVLPLLSKEVADNVQRDVSGR